MRSPFENHKNLKLYKTAIRKASWIFYFVLFKNFLSKILLRNICSDQVAKRIPGSCSHEPIYKGAKCGTKWFEVSLVNQSDCIDGGIYNVDSCLNDFKSIVIAWCQFILHDWVLVLINWNLIRLNFIPFYYNIFYYILL